MQNIVEAIRHDHVAIANALKVNMMHTLRAIPHYTTPSRNRFLTANFDPKIDVSSIVLRRRRNSSKPVLNHDFEQYPCFLRAGYFVPMSLDAIWQAIARTMAEIPIKRLNLLESFILVSSRFSPFVLQSANMHSMNHRQL